MDSKTREKLDELVAKWNYSRNTLTTLCRQNSDRNYMQDLEKVLRPPPKGPPEGMTGALWTRLVALSPEKQLECLHLADWEIYGVCAFDLHYTLCVKNSSASAPRLWDAINAVTGDRLPNPWDTAK